MCVCVVVVCVACVACVAMRMAVRAAVTHLAGHCGTKCLACCHRRALWYKVPGVLSLSTPMATTTTTIVHRWLRAQDATGCHLSLMSGNVSTAVPTSGGGYMLSQGGVYMFKCVSEQHQHVFASTNANSSRTSCTLTCHWCSRQGTSACSPHHHQQPS